MVNIGHKKTSQQLPCQSRVTERGHVESNSRLRGMFRQCQAMPLSRAHEFMKELDVTEGRSAGIPKILKVMVENGSPFVCDSLARSPLGRFYAPRSHPHPAKPV